ncbi:hypothetical protein M422DRAFT_244766 [Sphaerobolus stellatus SS14]|nr:hypothetical protein M422DRAFT_244766 [Sphaerobolus stellatus SS14]
MEYLVHLFNDRGVSSSFDLKDSVAASLFCHIAPGELSALHEQSTNIQFFHLLAPGLSQYASDHVTSVSSASSPSSHGQSWNVWNCSPAAHAEASLFCLQILEFDQALSYWKPILVGGAAYKFAPIRCEYQPNAKYFRYDAMVRQGAYANPSDLQNDIVIVAGADGVPHDVPLKTTALFEERRITMYSNERRSVVGDEIINPYNVESKAKGGSSHDHHQNLP